MIRSYADLRLFLWRRLLAWMTRRQPVRFRSFESETGIVPIEVLLNEARRFAETCGERLININVVSTRLIVVWYRCEN